MNGKRLEYFEAIEIVKKELLGEPVDQTELNEALKAYPEISRELKTLFRKILSDEPIDQIDVNKSLVANFESGRRLKFTEPPTWAIEPLMEMVELRKGVITDQRIVYRRGSFYSYRLVALLLAAVLLTLAIIVLVNISQHTNTQPSKVVPASPPVSTSIRISWDLGEKTEQGAVFIGLCDEYNRNTGTAIQGCAKNNIINSKRTNDKIKGFTNKDLQVGKAYRVCLAADNFPGKVGRWRACKDFIAQDGVKQEFNMDDLQYITKNLEQ